MKQVKHQKGSFCGLAPSTIYHSYNCHIQLLLVGGQLLGIHYHFLRNCDLKSTSIAVAHILWVKYTHVSTPQFKEGWVIESMLRFCLP